MDMWMRMNEASVRKRRISRCSKYEGIGKVSNNSVGRYGIEGWMDGLGVGRAAA